MRVISRKKEKRQDHLTDLLKRFSIKFLTLQAIKNTHTTPTHTHTQFLQTYWGKEAATLKNEQRLKFFCPPHSGLKLILNLPKYFINFIASPLDFKFNLISYLIKLNN